MWTFCLLLFAAQLPVEPFTSPAAETPEYGYGLSATTAQAGWIALYDRQSAYGWTEGSSATNGKPLTGGHTTSTFASAQIQADFLTAGTISLGDQTFEVAVGKFDQMVTIE